MLTLQGLSKQKRMKLIERFKYIKLLRSLIYGTVGVITYPGLVLFNKIRIEGTEHLNNLPRHNVLFVSNHQTYFADVIAFHSYFLCG
jgi:1-acyl-sn-glycerol-3-phosphate acyltransferase